MDEKQVFGYCRVSARDQNEMRQVVAMQEFGIADSSIIVEKMSGKDFNRPRYKWLIKKLKPGDTLVIKSVDRLGRNYQEIIEQWRLITKETGAAIVVLDLPLLDTRQNGRDLTGVFIADMVLQIMSYMSELEKDFNHHRQKEGIAVAKERGVKFGRVPKERPELFHALREQWQQGKISARNAAQQLEISHPTFLAWVKNMEE